MYQNSFIYLSIFLAVLAVVLSPQSAEAKCNSCGSNGIACISETTFNMCFNGNPNTTQVFECPDGKICSGLSLKCIDPSTSVAADCSASQGCGICDGTKMFACTSRTTFAQCNGMELTTNTGECPQGLTCDSVNVETCVNDCNVPETLECDRETPL